MDLVEEVKEVLNKNNELREFRREALANAKYNGAGLIERTVERDTYIALLKGQFKIEIVLEIMMRALDFSKTPLSLNPMMMAGFGPGVSGFGQPPFPKMDGFGEQYAKMTNSTKFNSEYFDHKELIAAFNRSPRYVVNFGAIGLSSAVNEELIVDEKEVSELRRLNRAIVEYAENLQKEIDVVDGAIGIVNLNEYKKYVDFKAIVEQAEGVLKQVDEKIEAKLRIAEQFIVDLAEKKMKKKGVSFDSKEALKDAIVHVKWFNLADDELETLKKAYSILSK